MERTNQKLREGLFDSDDKLDNEKRKEIYNECQDAVMKYTGLDLNTYKKFLKIVNKFSEGKPKKFSKEQKKEIKETNEKY